MNNTTRTDKVSVNANIGQIILSDRNGVHLLGEGEVNLLRGNVSKNFIMFFGMEKRTGIFEIDFLMYLIQNAHRNKLHYYRDERLAKEFEVTRQTIERIKKKFRKADIIKYNVGIIMINPKMFFKGKAHFRMETEREWDNFEEFKEKHRKED